MAKRFGGTYSPGGKPDSAPPAPRATPLKGAKPARAAGRSNFLFLAALAFLIPAFRAEPVVMATWLAACGALILGAWLTREGLKAQDAFEARKVARRPAIPRKIFGALCSGAGLALAGLAGHGPVEAAIFALLGTGLHLGAFGLDPLADKGMDGIDRRQQDRVARAVEAAETTLSEMRAAVLRTRDRDVLARTDAFAQTARAMFRTVENDPRDLSAARRYLGVYLGGARDAAEKYADLVADRPNPEARADFLSLLDDLDGNFAARREKLLTDDRAALDVEIGVLRDRLAREGLRHDD